MRTLTAQRDWSAAPERGRERRPSLQVDAMNLVTIAICLAVGIAFHMWVFAIVVGAVYALAAMSLGGLRVVRRRLSKAR